MKTVGSVLWNLPEIIGAALLLAITLIIGAAVTSRYLFFFALTWSEELMRFMFIWVSFIGGAAAAKHLDHFRLLVLRDALPPRLQLVLDIFGHACFIAFGGVLLVAGIEMSTLSMEQLSPALYIPKGLVYSVMPISGALMIFYSTIHILRELADRRVPDLHR